MLSFKPAFLLSSFTLIKRLFSSSSLSTIKVVSSAYLRLFLFLLAILIPACYSSSPAFHILYTAYKLNKQGDNIQNFNTPFPILNQSIVPCMVLTVPSWLIYRFLREFSTICCDPCDQRCLHSQWGRSRCCSGLCSLHDPMNVVNLISGSSVFSKSSLYIWNFSVHILLKPSLKDFEHYLASMWNECDCTIVWTFFGIAFLWDWNESLPFPVLWPLLNFPNLLAYWVQHFHSIIFQDLK